MNWIGEAIRSIVTALGVVTGNAQAIDRLDTTERGFWLSFTAIVPIVPLYLYAAAGATGAAETAASPAAEGAPMAAYATSLLVQWIAWPVIVALLARLFGWGATFVRYIVAYNWTSPWVMLALTPPVILHGLGVTGAAMNLFVLASFVLALWMRWFVAKHGLQVAGEIAAALVLADLLLGTLIDGALT
jgi:hypothetical protein